TLEWTMSEFTLHTALVTGATGGIGFATARLLAAEGATVLVHGRTKADTEDAVARLADSGVNRDRLTPVVADFARLGEVRAQAGRTAVSVHPGVTGSGLLRLYGTSGQLAADAAALVARLCLPEADIVPGGYYNLDTLTEPASTVTDPRAPQRLWRLAAQLV